MTAKQTSRIEVFFSYSHKDQHLCHQLETQLSLLKREGLISNWHARKILAGEEWEGQIDKHLKYEANCGRDKPVACSQTIIYVNYPTPVRRELVSMLHRNSAYRCRRAALASSHDTSGHIDKMPMLVQSCRTSSVLKAMLRAPIKSAWRVEWQL